jgi:hypothetical protein
MNFLKAEQLSNAKWRVLSIPFGGPFPREGAPKGADLDEEWFSERTDIKEAWFDRRPLVWHHNLDGTMKADPVVGTSDDTEKAEDEGWWSTIWLDRSHRYWEQIDAMLRAGKVYGSSGSLPNFVRTDAKTGEILVSPFIEQTLTPTPANPYSRVVAAKAIDHFDEARIGLSPAVRDLLSDLDSQPADLQSDLSTDGELGEASPIDLSTGGDDAAIQRLATDPDRERVIRQLVAAFGDSRLDQLRNR